jgi:hypothetical protein
VQVDDLAGTQPQTGEQQQDTVIAYGVNLRLEGVRGGCRSSVGLGYLRRR